MTAKEKATELFNRFRGRFYFLLTNEAIKDCALIAVDEIIKVDPLSPSKWTGDYRDSERVALEYWQEVKKEIKSL